VFAFGVVVTMVRSFVRLGHACWRDRGP